MKKNHNFYVKQFVRTLKDFDEYNQELVAKLYTYAYSREGFLYAPHVFCTNALCYSVINYKKHNDMIGNYYIEECTRQFLLGKKNYFSIGINDKCKVVYGEYENINDICQVNERLV